VARGDNPTHARRPNTTCCATNEPGHPCLNGLFRRKRTCDTMVVRLSHIWCRKSPLLNTVVLYHLGTRRCSVTCGTLSLVPGVDHTAFWSTLFLYLLRSNSTHRVLRSEELEGCSASICCVFPSPESWRPSRCTRLVELTEFAHKYRDTEWVLPVSEEHLLLHYSRP
jgi:hypothetical protein